MKKILPFYMTYPLPITFENEDKVMEDLEYLQQMYPVTAKRYQKRIAEILDRMDYEGSMIYDDYPDRWQLYRLSQTIVDILMKEDMNMETPPMNQMSPMSQSPSMNGMHQEEQLQLMEMRGQMSSNGERSDQDKRKWLSDMVEILLYHEIFKRRRRQHKGYFNQ